MPGGNVRHRSAHGRTPAWRSRSRPRMSERARPTAAERLQADLADNGVQAGICRIKRIRKELGPRCRQKKKFRATTDSKHSLPVAPNLLDRRFAVAAPNKAWATDITYIATDESWLYLAGVKDLLNGELVGYALDSRMTQNLVTKALFRAVAAKRPGNGLIHHSDRGSQYCAHAYQKLLRQFGMQVSMSRRDNSDSRLNRWTPKFASDLSRKGVGNHRAGVATPQSFQTEGKSRDLAPSAAIRGVQSHARHQRGLGRVSRLNRKAADRVLRSEADRLLYF